MVQHREDVFAALGHRTRLQVMAACCRRPHSTTELSRLCAPITLTGMRKHLAVLEDAGLIERRKSGRTVWCTARPGALDDATAYLAQLQTFWTGQLDSLARHLEDS
ncbi:helix-turn-helix transcriptional regulator [Calidifontibacter sp. DB0510]|uniref:Helix-turn-helix transcriptional regulator n=1 Tax=Metallococcus carri TaxID=1656884 RepID=A0A967AZ39_9MICO|nr:metalloregulator ArsR/SmtB family transcription factor [Metallococcus carri]NHN54280.1 helix-turn-helix transcriptional regulator [Metallococcus carri]NOP36880.1 helix-turn-helix transcriptional regulator [Calidifontibacter sp. DB2511S]